MAAGGIRAGQKSDADGSLDDNGGNHHKRRQAAPVKLTMGQGEPVLLVVTELQPAHIQTQVSHECSTRQAMVVRV